MLLSLLKLSKEHKMKEHFFLLCISDLVDLDWTVDYIINQPIQTV